MATIRIYNYEYGNYNETLTPNTSDLNVLFRNPLAVYDNINISYNDGIMLTLTLNISDDLIEQTNYLTIDSGYHKGSLTFSNFITTDDEADFTDEGGIKLGDINDDWDDEILFLNWLQDNGYDPDEMERGLNYVYSYDTNLFYGITLSKNFDTYDNIRPYFVLGYQYIMKDQYAVSCKLDTVLYKLDDIKGADALIERGFIDDDNTLIYNNEGIEVTSIKQVELPITEKVDSVQADVGYYAVYVDSRLGSTPAESDKLELKVSGASKEIYATYSKLEDVPIYNYIDNPTTFGSITKAETYVRGYNYCLTSVGASGAMRGFVMNISSTLDGTPCTNLSKFITTSTGTIITDNHPYNEYKKEHEFYNANPKLGMAFPSKGFGGYRYKVDGVEIPYIGMYDFRRNSVYSLGLFTGYHWGGIQSAGGVGIGVREDDDNNFPFTTSEIATAVKTNILDGYQYNSTTFTGTGLTEAGLKQWNDRLITVGEITYRITVEETTKSGTVRANSPLTMLKYLANNTLITNQEWAPQQDVNSLRVLTKKNEINTKIWNTNHWAFDGLSSGERDRLTSTTKDYNYETIHYELSGKTYTIRINPEFIGAIKTIKTFGGSNDALMLNPIVENQPYKVLLFPFGNIMLKSKSTQANASSRMQTEYEVLSVVNNLINDYGSSGSTATRIYDVQRVPYGSISLEKYKSGTSTTTNLIYFYSPNNNTTDYKNDEMYLIKDGDATPRLLMFTPFKAARTFDTELAQPITKQDLKIDICTRSAIALSNTYKTQYNYEFAKNDYNNKFRITVDLKPITPYFNIDVIGSDNGLIQGNFSDGRGINQAEDLSATQITDVFNAYKRENMNYLNSFNSQQDYERMKLANNQANEQARLNLKNSQAWESYGVSAGSSILKGAAAGAVAGTIGGPLGTLGGAVVGGVTGLANAGLGALSMSTSNKQAQESLALEQAQGRDTLGLTQAQALQQFNYSVQNIQALPPRLDKVSGVSALAKNTARLAFYDTTEEEKQRVRDYFKFNAYTLNVYDTLGKYIDYDKDLTYVKGTIYRFNKSINNAILQDINTRLTVGIQFRKVGDE